MIDSSYLLAPVAGAWLLDDERSRLEAGVDPAPPIPYTRGPDVRKARDGAPIRYKAWVCSNPECGFNIRIDNGEISYGRTVSQSHK